MRCASHVSWVCSLLVAAALYARPSSAFPRPGTPRPTVRLQDAWDRTLDLGAASGRPLLVLYEDKNSSSQNQTLKDELAALAAGDRYRGRVTLVAIADVQDYDFWPARRFVKDAIRTESQRFRTDIYCDWDGGARLALGVNRGVSSVLLYGADGKTRFAYEGALPKDKREELIRLLGKELDD